MGVGHLEQTVRAIELSLPPQTWIDGIGRLLGFQKGVILQAPDHAAGRIDGYWERDLKPWDVAAGLILVREAGGFVTDCDGGDDIFHKGHIVACNEAIQKELVAVLKKAGKP